MEGKGENDDVGVTYKYRVFRGKYKYKYREGSCPYLKQVGYGKLKVKHSTSLWFISYKYWLHKVQQFYTTTCISENVWENR